MKQCKCEHWETCPVCYPQGFDESGTRKPVEIPPTRDEMLERIKNLKAERDELAAQVEKMQEALKLSERCFDLIKDVKGPLDWHLILKSELVIKRALSTPDISTGILNRVRAEALLMAACVIELYGDATLREEDYRLNSAECGDIIRALAADMGAGKCQVY